MRHGDRELDVAVHISESGYSLYVRDVTEYRQAQAELQQRLRVEAALANVAPLFLMGDDEELDDALAELGRLVDPTRAYIFAFDGTVFSNTHEWCAPGVESLHDIAQDLEASRFPVLATALQAGRVLDIPDTSKLPAEAAGERDVLERWAIRTALAVPVIGPHGVLKAFLGFDDVRGPRVWSQADLRTLKVAAQMLGSRYARAGAEAALRRSEERYRLATRATQDIIYEWDIESGALEQASAFESNLADPGTRDTDGLEWWATQIHPDDRDDVTAGLELALANGRDVWSDEYRFRRADGGYAMVLDRGHILRDDEGRPMRLIGAVSDITERRTAEDALRASRTASRRQSASPGWDRGRWICPPARPAGPDSSSRSSSGIRNSAR